MSKRPRRAYFKTFALKHGPAFFGIPVAAPRVKVTNARRRQLDEDGVVYSILEDYDSLERYPMEVKHLVWGTIASDINVRRALREQVEGKVESLTRDVTALKEQLDRIERKLDALCSQP